MKYSYRNASLAVLVFCLLSLATRAQVTNDRLLHATDEPQNWLTYSGSYSSWRYSLLKQITPANVKNIEQKWVFQADSLEKFETTPLVVDGIMYLTQAPSDVVALDAKNRPHLLDLSLPVSTDARACCGSVNHGLAILGDTLYLATLDAHLVAIDAKAGRPLWKTKVANAASGYAMTLAPLVVKDKVIVGVAGGEFGIRGFVAAFDAKSGAEVWRTYTVPGPASPVHESWQGNSWEHGGGPVWLTGFL
jgi:alcohol dehydrogenase (cytochrome c)